jgi:hypothetical protein
MFMEYRAVGSLSLLLVSCASSSGASTNRDAGGGSNLASLPDGATTQEFSWTMSPLDVPVGVEVYKCQDFDNPFGKDIAIVTSESVMTKGAHHFAAFRIAGLTAAPMTDCPAGGLEAHEFIHASQQFDQVTTYPPNVGRFLPATDGLRLMVHLLNATTDIVHVQPTRFSAHFVAADQVQYKAAGVFLNNLGLSVPPGQSSVTKSAMIPSDIKLLGAVSHMHSHGVGFTSSTGDGRKIYESTTWAEPQAESFDPPMQITGGTTITWTCSFQNDTAQTLTFGQSAATNEMCIFNGVYYPSPDGSSIVQNLN